MWGMTAVPCLVCGGALICTVALCVCRLRQFEPAAVCERDISPQLGQWPLMVAVALVTSMM